MNLTNTQIDYLKEVYYNANSEHEAYNNGTIGKEVVNPLTDGTEWTGEEREEIMALEAAGLVKFFTPATCELTETGFYALKPFIPRTRLTSDMPCGGDC